MTVLTDVAANAQQVVINDTRFFKTELDLNKLFECYASETGDVILSFKQGITIMTGGDFNVMSSDSINILSGAITSNNKSGMINLNPDITTG
jgi:hypothetical protein